MDEPERDRTFEEPLSNGDSAAVSEYEAPAITILGSVDQLTAGFDNGPTGGMTQIDPPS